MVRGGGQIDCRDIIQLLKQLNGFLVLYVRRVLGMEWKSFNIQIGGTDSRDMVFCLLKIKNNVFC